MKKILTSAVQGRGAILIIATLAMGCSSVPNFKPSHPIEEAANLNDALGICGEYQIKGDQNTMGRALPERVVVLTPWIRCFENLFRKFPETRALDREEFVHFFRALQARHDGAQPDAKVVDWPEMNFAVAHSIEHMQKNELPFSDPERKAIDRQLPSYGMFLAESGRLSRGDRNAVRTQVLEGSKSQTTSEGFLEGIKPLTRPMPLSAEQKEYCKKYRAHQSLLHNLEELGEYQRVLEERTYEDTGNTNEIAAKERVRKRVENMREQAKISETELTSSMGELKAKSRWFQNGHCL